MYLVKKAPLESGPCGIPEGLHEEEHGRQGFSGPVSPLSRIRPQRGAASKVLCGRARNSRNYRRLITTRRTGELS